jgi:hypothetical protein
MFTSKQATEAVPKVVKALEGVPQVMAVHVASSSRYGFIVQVILSDGIFDSNLLLLNVDGLPVRYVKHKEGPDDD